MLDPSREDFTTREELIQFLEIERARWRKIKEFFTVNRITRVLGKVRRGAPLTENDKDFINDLIIGEFVDIKHSDAGRVPGNRLTRRLQEITTTLGEFETQEVKRRRPDAAGFFEEEF